MFENLSHPGLVGFLLTSFVCITLFIVFLMINRKIEKSNHGLDERQILARGRAFTASSFAALAYLSSNMIIEILGLSWSAPHVSYSIGFHFVITAFAVPAILGDAYTLFLEKARIPLCVFSGVGAVGQLYFILRKIFSNLISSKIFSNPISSRQNDVLSYFVVDGMLTEGIADIAKALSSSLIFIALLVYCRRVRKELQAEE